MKHRTVTVFIVVLAALAAVPQAFEQLSALKGAAGNHLTAGVWHAFLSLHGQKVEGGARAQVLPQMAGLVRVSAPDAHLQTAQSARRDARPSKSAERGTAAPRVLRLSVEDALGVVQKEVAMLDGLDELISAGTSFEGDVLMRHAPRMPAAAGRGLLPVSTPAPRVDVDAVVFKFGKLLKGAGLKHFQEHLKTEYVRRAASGGAADVEAPRAAEYVWRLDEGSPASRTPSCDVEKDEQLTN